MKLPLVLLFSAIVIASCSQPKLISPVIIKFDFLDKVDTMFDGNRKVMGYAKRENFLVKNYKAGDSIAIDRFVENSRDKEWAKKYLIYALGFYKESKITNYKDVLQNHKILADYSGINDLIYYYLWEDKKFQGKERFSHEKSNISVDDVDK